MNRGVIIAGTGTGVGKTVITSIILTGLRQRGIDAIPMKPVQTGATTTENGDWLIPDLDYACRVIGLSPDEETRSRMAPFCYRNPYSPHLAAEIENREPPNPERIRKCVEELLDEAPAVIVETAGGIMVPLNKNQTNLDLILLLNMPVILAADAGLGTINHTLLSIRVLQDSGVKLLGVILSETRPVEDKQILQDNPGSICRFGNMEIMGRVPYVPRIDPGDTRSWHELTGMISGIETLIEILSGN
jgi:dethiobiotin synthetase